MLWGMEKVQTAKTEKKRQKGFKRQETKNWNVTVTYNKATRYSITK